MDLSVVICTYNRADRLREALVSLETGEVPADLDWEVLVVDNNSRDGTSAVVHETAARGRLPIRGVFERHQGLCHARNRGVREARGAAIAFTDDDVVFHRDWLTALAGAFCSTECLGVGGRVVPTWGFPIPRWVAPLLKPPYALMDIVLVEHGLGRQPRTYAGSRRMPVGANMAFRREAFERHGLFVTALDRVGTGLLSGGDTEFCLRLLAHGETLVYRPDAVVYHPVERGRVTRRYARRWFFNQGRSAARVNAVLRRRDTPFLAVPVGPMKHLAGALLRYLRSQVGLYPQPDAAELEVIRQCGRVWESLRCWCAGHGAGIPSPDSLSPGRRPVPLRPRTVAPPPEAGNPRGQPSAGPSPPR